MKKISEVFLSYVEPYLEVAGDPHPNSREFKNILKLGHLVWNAVVFNKTRGKRDFLAEIQRTVDEQQEKKLIEMLVRDKEEKFPDDVRLIGEYEIVTKRDGSTVLRAEARVVQVH